MAELKLEDTVKHAKSVAKEQRIISSINAEGIPDCIKCAEEHEQLAAWFEELMALRERTKWIPATERLPERVDEEGNSDDVLVVREFARGGNFYDVDYYNHRLEMWVCASQDPVIAWMPIPEYGVE